MTKRPRILFDETFGKPAVDRLRDFLYPDPEDETSAIIQHLFDFRPSGTADSDWIPRLADEGWIVISADRGINSGRGEKLPQLCVEFAVTHVLLSGTVHQKCSTEKMQMVVSVWGQIVRLPSEPQGSRYVLRAISNRPEDIGRGKLQKKEPRARN